VSQPLAIVGASTRSAAASAVRAGFQPLAADLFADADLRRIATVTRISPYPEGFVDWMRTVEPPAWMYTGALENHPELIDQLAWIAPLWGNAGDVLARVRSPWELSNTLANADLRFPEIRESDSGLPGDGSWLWKTYTGASGSGVRAWNEPRGANDEGKSGCFQKRIDGVPSAVAFVADGDRAQLLGVTRQLIGESWLESQDFQYAGSIGPWPISQAVSETLQRLGDILVAEFELIGLFGVDFILHGDEVWTLEVNPRYTASIEIVERFTGTSAIAAHVTACGGQLRKTQQATQQPAFAACGKAILFAPRRRVIGTQFAEQSLAEATRTPWPSIADVSTAGSVVEAGRPILTIFADGASCEEVEQKLRTKAAEIYDQLERQPEQTT
jgi:predicted ATP-grasp superfamily ATP-dependent carboligase